READGVAVTDRVDGLTGIDVDQLDTLGGVQVDLDVGGVGLDEELADDLTGVAGGLFRSDPQGGLGLLLGQILGVVDQVGVNLLEVVVVAVLFEDLVVAEVPDRRLGGPQGVPGVEAVDTDLGTQFLGSHVRVAVLQDPVDLAGLGEVALARVVGPVVLQVPGATTDAGLEVDAVHLQDGVAVLDVQVEDGGSDGTTTHVDGGTTLVVVDVLGAGGACGPGGGQAECQERGGACGKAHAPGGTGEGDVSQIVSRCRLEVTGRRCPPLKRVVKNPVGRCDGHGSEALEKDRPICSPGSEPCRGLGLCVNARTRPSGWARCCAEARHTRRGVPTRA